MYTQPKVESQKVWCSSWNS